MPSDTRYVKTAEKTAETAETKRMEREKERKCPGCGSAKLVRDYEHAELICAGCGLVVRDGIMDMGPEWRAFDQEQKERRSRTGAPMDVAIHDKGLPTVIDWRDKDSYGKDLTPDEKAQVHRLRKWQYRIRVSDAAERNLASAFTELDRMAAHLRLPRNVREAAAAVYRRAVKERLIKGRSIEGMVAASLYAACRECNIPRTLDEIAEVFRTFRTDKRESDGKAGAPQISKTDAEHPADDTSRAAQEEREKEEKREISRMIADAKKEIGRSYRFMARKLLIRMRPTRPIDYVSRFASGLGLTGDVQTKAIELLTEAAEKGLTSGRGPTGTAAAAIYIASVLCGERRTQHEVADAAGVTEVTVRNRFKELSRELGLDAEM